MRWLCLHMLCTVDLILRYLGAKANKVYWADLELCTKYNDYCGPVVYLLLRLPPRKKA